MTYKDNYKKLAKFYDIFLGGNFKRYGEIINLISDNYIKETENINILDIGCGTAGILDYIKYSNYVDGIDISENMLKIARSNFPNNNFYKMSFDELSLNKKYDFVFSIFDTLNHVKDENDFNKIIFDTSVLLKDGGIFFFDINTLFKFKSFKSEIFQVIKDKNQILTINREFELPNVGKWNIEILMELEGYDGYYNKSTSVVKEISFDLDNLFTELSNVFSKVIIFDLDNLDIDLNVTVDDISKCGKISRLGFLCIK